MRLRITLSAFQEMEGGPVPGGLGKLTTIAFLDLGGVDLDLAAPDIVERVKRQLVAWGKAGLQEPKKVIKLKRPIIKLRKP
jgi:hypothetical protein